MALWLRSQGYRAFALLGGLAGWLDAGYPIEEKECERRTLAGVCADCGGDLGTHRPTRRPTSPEEDTDLFLQP